MAADGHNSPASWPSHHETHRFLEPQCQGAHQHPSPPQQYILCQLHTTLSPIGPPIRNCHNTVPTPTTTSVGTETCVGATSIVKPTPALGFVITDSMQVLDAPIAYVVGIYCSRKRPTVRRWWRGCGISACHGQNSNQQHNYCSKLDSGHWRNCLEAYWEIVDGDSKLRGLLVLWMRREQDRWCSAEVLPIPGKWLMDGVSSWSSSPCMRNAAHNGLRGDGQVR